MEFFELIMGVRNGSVWGVFCLLVRLYIGLLWILWMVIMLFVLFIGVCGRFLIGEGFGV